MKFRSFIPKSGKFYSVEINFDIRWMDAYIRWMDTDSRWMNIDSRWMIIDIRWMIIDIRWMVSDIRWMDIDIQETEYYNPFIHWNLIQTSLHHWCFAQKKGKWNYCKIQ